MKRVGWFRAAAQVARKDLTLEWQTWETLSVGLLFSLTVIVVFGFAFGASATREFGVSRMVPGVLWTVLGFATIVGGTRASQIEKQNDALGALLLTPVDRSSLFLGKWLANLVKFALLAGIVAPLSAVFLGYELLPIAIPLAGLLLLNGMGMTVLGTLFATVVVRIGRGEALMATLFFPAATPLFLSAVRTTAALLDGDPGNDAGRWLLMAAGFDLLYLALALLVFEFVLED